MELSANVIILIVIGIITILSGAILFIVTKNSRDLDLFSAEDISDKNKPLEDDFVKNDIDKMLEVMTNDIGSRDLDLVQNFETEQEEKAIISYHELLEKTQRIDPNEIKATLDFEKEKVITEQKSKENIKKFKNAEFISPIYGKQENKGSYPTVKKIDEKIESKLETKKEITFEDTFDLKPLSTEIKKSEKFLEMLKDFRNNLE